MRTLGFRRNGFSLVEAVVVMGVISLLAAIIVPMVAGAISKGKIARALEDCRAIANAIEKFYQDVNQWPSMGSDGSYDTAYVLESGQTLQTASPYGFITADVYTTAWATANSGGTTHLDLLDNHLNTNTPFGLNTNIYPTSGEHKWRGPYMQKSPLDPWGHPYLVSICAPLGIRVADVFNDLSFSRWVVSAGPDGVMSTRFQPTASTGMRGSLLGGDDIGVRFDIEDD